MLWQAEKRSDTFITKADCLRKEKSLPHVRSHIMWHGAKMGGRDDGAKRSVL